MLHTYHGREGFLPLAFGALLSLGSTTMYLLQNRLANIIPRQCFLHYLLRVVKSAYHGYFSIPSPVSPESFIVKFRDTAPDHALMFPATQRSGFWKVIAAKK